MITLVVKGIPLSASEYRKHQENIRKLAKLSMEQGAMDWAMVLYADVAIIDEVIKHMEEEAPCP